MGTDVEALLLPIDTAAPAGADLRYQPIYDEIKAARRLAETEPGEVAGWKKVAELAVKATTRSKDLQLAIWLLEAFARIDGYRGAGSGLLILRRLVDDYWDTVYPRVDPDDSDPLEFRRALLHWVDDRLPGILKTAPLSGPPAFYGLIHYEVTQKSGDEKKALLDEGWPSYEQFDQALQASATPYLEAVLEAVALCEAELKALQTAADARFNDTGRAAEPLKFVRLREALDTARWLVERPLKKRQGAVAADEQTAGANGAAAAVSVVTVNGDELWTEALTLTRGSKVDGLRLMQTQLAAATSGRDRFLRQLQLAELSLEAGVYSLAFPVFDELVKVVDARHLEEWEDHAVVTRVLKGLARCCELLKTTDATYAQRESEARERAARLESARTV
jgi:type VI secretion system protein ImpA